MKAIEGFAGVTGGKGGQWVRVENLNPEGELSLRHALTRDDIPGPRNIGFRVSGDIFGSINTGLSNATINGETSPGGICLRNDEDDLGDTLNFTGDNIIVNNLRIRPGSTSKNASESRRALNFQGTKGAIVSNCSLTWGYDQITGAWYGPENILFYRNIIAEGLHESNGKYGMGALVGDKVGGTGGGDVYFYQNLFAHNRGRNPKLNIAGIAYLWNNLVLNPGDWVMHLDDRFGPPRADVVGNVVITGAQSNNNSQSLLYTGNKPAKVFFHDNLTPNREWWHPGQVDGVVPGNTKNLTVQTKPFMEDIPFEMVAARNLKRHLLEVVGARPLDITDQRILQSVRTETGIQIPDEKMVGGYPRLERR